MRDRLSLVSPMHLATLFLELSRVRGVELRKPLPLAASGGGRFLLVEIRSEALPLAQTNAERRVLLTRARWRYGRRK